MTRAIYRFLDSDPPSASRALLAVRDAIGERARLFVPGPWQSSWVGRGERHFVYVADTRAGRRRILFEAERLAWAVEHGISVPPVVAAAPDGSWLATRRVPDDTPAGEAYVEGAISIARAFQAAASPPPSVPTDGRGRRAPRWSLPVRMARLAASPIPIREFATVRRRARALPADVLAHGDFHPGNLLFDRDSGRVFVTDMESMGFAPNGTDLLTLWCGLDHAEDRDAVLDALLSGTGREEREPLAVLHHWLALRWLGDVTLVPRRFRVEDDREARIEHAMARLDEAREHAGTWGRTRAVR